MNVLNISIIILSVIVALTLAVPLISIQKMNGTVCPSQKRSGSMLDILHEIHGSLNLILFEKDKEVEMVNEMVKGEKGVVHGKLVFL